ncbi:ADC synthase [Paraphysoderma sedebokerense]|nr:ADC synthase [Paraphysoderma sedebokerense]
MVNAVNDKCDIAAGIPQDFMSYIKILIVDNYDSYTFNLYQLCCFKDAKYLPVVIRNDQFGWDEFKQNIMPYFDCIIISPGPGRPERKSDFGICEYILRHATCPVFGICLGHQGLAHVYGGKVTYAAEVMHGRLSKVHHTGVTIFKEIPVPFHAVRYHSLIVDENELPGCLQPIAWTYEEDGSRRTIMGLQHREKPLYGVQFHPESICTEYGFRLMSNFRALVAEHITENDISVSDVLPDFFRAISVLPSDHAHFSPMTARSPRFKLTIKKLDNIFVDSEVVFKHLYDQGQISMWLDSAKVQKEVRYSYMGDWNGPNSFLLRYNIASKCITVSTSRSCQLSKIISFLPSGYECCTSSATEMSIQIPHSESVFDYLHEFILSVKFDEEHVEMIGMGGDCSNVPFDFIGGLAGYVGYEMKEECLVGYSASRWRDEESMQQHDENVKISMDGPGQTPNADDLSSNINGGAQWTRNSFPDLSFLFMDRVVVFDHVDSQIYLCALHENDNEHHDSLKWMGYIEQQIESLRANFNQCSPSLVRMPTKSGIDRSYEKHFLKAHTQIQYISNIEQAQQYIHEGETYEVCLTSQFYYPLSSLAPSERMSPFEFYSHLRQSNPAPYASYFRMGNHQFIAGSSPERFLKVDKNGFSSLKPIKGTVERCKDNIDEDERRKQWLKGNVKDRAENLMIVDLIRNDLNYISQPRTVQVPNLMHVETYETVHQLVTTITGKLHEHLTALDALRHTFPPGSMTGSPKLRTVQILDSLEKGIPRGVYSGCMGYLSLNGAAHFNVVIRSVVGDGNGLKVGAGGAIVSLSDKNEEYEEVIVKLGSVARSVVECYGVRNEG